MAFVHGKDTRVMINRWLASVEIKGWKASWKRDYADSTVLGDSGAKGIPGLTEGEFEVEGLLVTPNGQSILETVNTDANGTDSALNMTIQPTGNTLGEPAIFAVLNLSDFEIESEVGDAVKVTLTGETNGGTDIGHIHKAHAAETVSTNQASVDNAVSSANGGAAMMHIEAVSGTTPSMTVKIQHSADNSVWADLITFTAATVVGYESKTVAAGTTVDRYTRSISTITGTSPSFTYTVAFARR